MVELVSQRITCQLDPPVAGEATSTLHMCCYDVDSRSTNVCGDCGRQTNLDKLGLLSGSVSIVVAVCVVLGLWPLDPLPCSKCSQPSSKCANKHETHMPRAHMCQGLLQDRLAPKAISIRILLKSWSHQRMVRFLEYSQRRKICHIPSARRLQSVGHDQRRGTQMWFSVKSLRR